MLRCCTVFGILLVLVEAKYGYVQWDEGKPAVFVSELNDEIPAVHAARATYHNEINETGWAFLELHTNADTNDERQAFSAGYLEAFLTRDLIWNHWQNMLKGYCYNKTDVCSLMEKFIDTQEDYIAEMVKKNNDDSYWHQIKLIYIQIEGLAAGYNAATEDPYQLLTIRDFVWLNMLGSLDDLSMAVSLPAALPERMLFGAHCSGLVKLLPGGDDLFVAQTTWYSYQSMTRIQKLYSLAYGLAPSDRRLPPGHRAAFSGYPGLVHSLDDFNVLSSGLVTAETTIANSNRSLFRLIEARGQVPQFARSLLANRLARSGEGWVKLYRKHNSGTYNNQWYVVDYKRFTPRRGDQPATVRRGLLWVLEQLPGYVEAEDLTHILRNSSYFPSYNIAYFPRVFNLSGGVERVALYGDWFSYDGNPRAAMFRDLQDDVCDTGSMLRVMRYNDFRFDPRARCACRPPYSACNAIAARNDLNPANGTYPFAALGHRSHGATDAKVTSSSLRAHLMFLAVSGPTHNVSRGIPPFRWSEFDLAPKISHVGLPDLWTFAPLIHRWEWH